MDYQFLSKFWMFIAKKYSTFNEFMFISEYSVLLSLTKPGEEIDMFVYSLNFRFHWQI